MVAKRIFGLLFICVVYASCIQILERPLGATPGGNPLCVWYRSAPFCGSGDDCPNDFPYVIDECGTSDEGKACRIVCLNALKKITLTNVYLRVLAAYCQSFFGHTCWTGSKILCCNLDINPKNASFTCGDYGFYK